MARQTATLALLVCALVVAGPAGATDYNDDYGGGDWDDQYSWNPSDVAYPATGDNAVIDSSTIILPTGYTVPPVNSCEVRTGGVLNFRTKVAQDFPLTLAGGTLLSSNNAWDGATLDSDLNVSASSTIKDVYGCRWALNGAVVSATTAPHTLEVQTHSQHDFAVHLKAASPAYTGQWLVESGWLKPQANGALGAGTVTVGGGAGTGYLNFSGTGASQSGTAGPAIHVLANGQMQVNNDASVDFSNDPLITLDGGSLYTHWTGTYKDPIHVASDSTLQVSVGGMFLTGTVSGVAGATLNVTGVYDVYLQGNNAGFAGDIEINGGAAGLELHVNDGSLGSAGLVTAKSNGVLIFEEHYNAPPPVAAENGGKIQINFGRSGGATPFSATMALNDGGIFQGAGAASEASGLITLTGEATMQSSADLYISGTVTGLGKLIKTGAGTLYLTNPGNSYTGGTEVAQETLEVTAAGALGGGTATVNGSGVLRTNPAGGTGSAVFGACPAVRAESGGILKLNSTETKATKITLKEFGGLWVEGGGTPLDYDDNVTAHCGAILHESIDGSGPSKAYPTPTQIVPNAQSERYLWKGVSNLSPGAVTTYTVGLGGGGSLKGLAAMSTDVTMNNKVTVVEHHDGDGFSLYSPGGTFKLQGPTFTGSSVTLEGGGSFVLNSAAAVTGSIVTLDCRAASIEVRAAGAMGAGQTLNVHDGSALYLNSSTDTDGFGTSADPADFAAVNIKSGGMIYDPWSYSDGALTRGTVTVETGAGIYSSNSNSDWAAGAAVIFQPGTQVVLAANSDWNTHLDAEGDVSYVMQGNAADIGAAGTGTIYLNDTSRISGLSTSKLTTASGAIELAAGASQARVTAGTDDSLTLENLVSIPSGTLIVGDTASYSAISGLGEWTDYGQDGNVRLLNTANVIEKIDVEDGALTIEDAAVAPLGGADVHVGAAGTLVVPGGAVLTDQAITGSGLVRIPGNPTSSITKAGGSIDPGGNPTAGVLTFSMTGWTNRGLILATGGGGSRVQLVFDVVGTGTDAGSDYDRLALEDFQGLPNADLTVKLPMPSKNFKPAELAGKALDVITLADSQDLTGLVTGLDGFATAEIGMVGDPGAHYTGTVNYGNKKVTVTDLTWTAHKGDADLNDEVDVLDLAKLANNFGRKDDAVNWGVADFDLNGEVDVLDLAAIANAFGWKVTGGGGGAPVPEPMTLAILALGAVALVRRRLPAQRR